MDSAQILEARKGKIKEFLLNKKNFLQYILLAAIIWIGIYIRSRPLKSLVDATTGKYITLELDSTLWLRYARHIAEKGRLFDIDPMRFYPLGGNISDLGTFSSYFIAYLYKVLNLFMPSITIEYADIIYPIISMAILSLFLFLLIRKLFNWKVALLTTLFINVITSFLFRSLGGSSDHDILAAMFVVMAFYFYVSGWYPNRFWKIISYGVLASFSTVLARESAGAGNFVFLILGSFVIIEIFLNKFEKKDFYLFGSWLITTTLINVYFYGFGNGFLLFVGSIATGITYLAFLFASVEYVMFKTNLKKRYFSKIHLPEGFTSIIVTIILGSLFALIFFGFDFFTNKIDQIYRLLFKFYAETRWTLTVAENHKPFVTDWMGQMGKFFVFSFIIGSILLFFDMCKVFVKGKISKKSLSLSVILLAYFTLLFAYFLESKTVFILGFIAGLAGSAYVIYTSTKEKQYDLFLSSIFSLFIFGYIFSGYSASSIFNGTSSIARFVFFTAIIGLVSMIVIVYLITYFKNKELYSNIRFVNKKYTFIFVWFFVMIFAATSAIRLLFEFSIIAVIVASYFFVYISELIWKLKNTYFKYTALLIILLILFNPFAFAQGILIKDYNSSLNQAKYSGPGYNQLWQLAGSWVRENTPQDAVFAHWWDYGYWVQEGFQRATITDGGNFILWWNYLMGRNVLTAQSLTEPLGFLFAHSASYLLIVSDEIGKYPAYSTIGSNENYDRRSFIQTYVLDINNIQETRNGTIFVYSGGGFPLEENLIYQNKLLPAGSAVIGGFIVGTNINGENLSFSVPAAAVFYQNQRIDIPLSCLVFDNKRIEFTKDGAIDSCLKIIPVFQNNQVNNFGAAMYLGPRVKDSLFARLYLNNEDNDYFKLVYSTPDLPLGIINGQLIGPMRIWEINYPKKFDLNKTDEEYFLRTTYPDEKLFQI